MAGRPNAEDEDDEGPPGSAEAGEDAFRFQPGDEDGAGEQEAYAPEDAEGEPERVRERGRRDYRDEARAAREQAARLEAELQQLRSQVNQNQNQNQPREPTDQEFEQQIAAYPQEEQFRYRSWRQEQKLAKALQQNTFQTRDFIDKSSYDSRAINDPDRRRLAPKVEQTLANWRAAGVWQANREDVYRWVKGDLSEQNRGRAADARRQAEDRVARQQGRTQGGRSDQSPQPRARRYAPNDNSPEAVKARLLGPDGRGVLI